MDCHASMPRAASATGTSWCVIMAKLWFQLNTLAAGGIVAVPLVLLLPGIHVQTQAPMFRQALVQQNVFPANTFHHSARDDSLAQQIMELLGKSLWDLHAEQPRAFNHRMLACVAIEALTMLSHLHMRGCSPVASFREEHKQVYLARVGMFPSCPRKKTPCASERMELACAARYVHGDVKPENLVLSKAAAGGGPPRLHLVDLGLSEPSVTPAIWFLHCLVHPGCVQWWWPRPLTLRTNVLFVNCSGQVAL